MSRPTLYLMLGYPGSGKTTTARIIHDLTGAVHLWADQERRKRFDQPTHSHQENLELYKALNEKTGQLLSEGHSVIFDTTFNFYDDRQHLRNIADKYGAETKLIWLKTDRQMAQDRALHPDHAARNTYDSAMTQDRFDHISDRLEPPHDDEAFVAVDGTMVTPDYIRKLLF